LSQEAALDDVPSVPGSFDIVDMGNGELELPGYPHASTADGDTDHGGLGCSATGSGQS
jgi:hypothetical protein